MLTTFTGTLTDWTLFDVNRKYGTIQNMPYLQAKEFIVAVEYNGQTHKGQQRALVQRHVTKLRKEMEAQTFTPTPISASLDMRHQKNLTINEEEGTFSLRVDSSDPLLHTDGNHRVKAVGDAIALLEKLLLDPKTSAEDKLKYAHWLEQAKNVLFTVTVYFDGDPARDFVNLQAGKTVDPSHMLSLSLQSGALGDPSLRLALDVARELNKDVGSPFYSIVKFDSRSVMPLPISTLCARGASDLGTSLIGLAKVGLSAQEPKTPEFLAKAVVSAFEALKISHEEDANDGILRSGKALTPMVNGGLKGSSTMLAGVGMCLAYRLVQQGRSKASVEDLAQLIEAAKETLDLDVEGSFSGPKKRYLLGRFVKEFFSDIDCPKSGGIPDGLLTALSRSTFALPALPKVPKPRKPKATKPAKELNSAAKPKAAPRKTTPPNVSGPITVTNAPIVIQKPVSALAPIEAVGSEDESATTPEFIEAADAEVHRDLSDAKSSPSDGAVSGPWDAVEEIEGSSSASITNPLVSFLVAPFAVKPTTQPRGQEIGFMDGVAHHLD